MKLSFKFIEILLIPLQTALMFYFIPVRLLLVSGFNELASIIYKKKANISTFIFIISIFYTAYIMNNNRDMVRVLLCFSTFYFALRFPLPAHTPKNKYLMFILFFIVLEKFTLEFGFMFNSRDESGALFLFGEKSYASQIIFLLIILFGDWEKRKYQTGILGFIILLYFGGGLSAIYMIVIVMSFIVKFNKLIINSVLFASVLTVTYFSEDIYLILVGLVSTGVIDYADALRPLLNVVSFQESSILGHGKINLYEQFLMADEINRPWNKDWTSVSGQAILPILAYSIGWVGVLLMIFFVLCIKNDLSSRRDYLLYVLLMLNLMLQTSLVSIVNFIIVASLNRQKAVD
ncbi:hypothetical protein PQZ41_03040 [Planktomarina temperata]|nr:hypothetical protein [Planktomarina temperata]